MTTPVLEESRAATGTMRVGIMAGVGDIAVSDVAQPSHQLVIGHAPMVHPPI